MADIPGIFCFSIEYQTGPGMTTIIETRDLGKKYDKNVIIENLNLEILKHESVVLFAPSGAGKSTLLRIILGLENPFQGSLDIKTATNNISAVFHKPALLPHRTVKDNIFYIFRLKKMNVPQWARQNYLDWISICELEDFQDSYPHELSAGMKQKVAIIRSLVFKPQLLLLDEPFGSIDLVSRQKIIDFMKLVYPQTTYLLATHNLDDIGLFGKVRVLVFHDRPLENYHEIHLDTHNKSQYRKTLLEAIASGLVDSI